MGGQQLVPVKNIYYIEVRRHTLYIHVIKKNSNVEEVIQTRGSMQELERKLESSGFKRCSVSYLINLGHVTSIMGNDVYIAQTILPISRNHKRSFTEAFMRSLANGEVNEK